MNNSIPFLICLHASVPFNFIRRRSWYKMLYGLKRSERNHCTQLASICIIVSLSFGLHTRGDHPVKCKMLSNTASTNISPALFKSEKKVHACTQNIPQRWQWIILVKRFDKKTDALKLQAYFLTWQMEIREIDHEYWNVVYVKSKEDGLERVRQWRKNSKDFDRFNLDLQILKVQIGTK